ncbi:winged helix-turn-helix domain-containing protein [Serratia rubidaea]|uniref:winged helix-turn-helix domain-containing protein n=1 Tax=Serratia rubidaea TaxID=61652 RepID=UPI001783B6F7|nr:winged helix-turn-helix domain-containing protein [Serratia rubidaea]MBD8453231.1 winged helix-turn-helix domain-containing protein [Serratia rubidaea]
MKYRINAFLDYDATEGSLRLNDDGKSDTQLTITANALLYFIIQHPGIISRDDVMKRVWDDNGLVSSNSNLNQYLSMLRKAFRRYGIDNVIVTVSRGRLELNPELQIELIDDTPLHPAVLAAEPAPPPAEPLSAPPTPPAVAGDHDHYWGYSGAALVLLALSLFCWSWANGRSLTPLRFSQVAQEPFEVFSTDAMLDPRMRENYRKNFIAVKEKKDIRQHNGEQFLFFYGDKLQSNGLGRTFLAHCVKHQDNSFSYCDNYFYYSWKAV